MNITSVDIKDMLESESSLGLNFGVDLFIGREPSTPNNCVTVFDSVGDISDLTLDGVVVLDYPGIKIQVRNTSYLAAGNLCKQIKGFLNGKNNEIWTNTTYLVIKCVGGPALLDYDSNNRARWFVNFFIMCKEI